MPRVELPKVLVVTGPTASGKGAVAFELAQRLDAEIVSVDSVKIYRGMDIGAGKPSAEKRRTVRYHLIDIVEPTEVYNMGRYVADATAALEDIARRDKRAILVGGTAMYLKGLLKGVFEGPPADPALRQKLRDVALEKGASHLHNLLRKVDPAAADKLHPNDLK
ncbi:MAG: tRNA (adenosine(37)-N6)-dimethylallyltransferase MiaA, partial [Planctomycetes bacterium]|nr:tRNA (adenosine(37)-N6)-dimethylallyltransferase MiaA [Planctomycetota bacterium]